MENDEQDELDDDEYDEHDDDDDGDDETGDQDYREPRGDWKTWMLVAFGITFGLVWVLGIGVYNYRQSLRKSAERFIADTLRQQQELGLGFTTRLGSTLSNFTELPIPM